MIKVRLDYALLAVCGAILGALGPSGFVSGNIALVPVILSIGGIGIIAGVVYEVFISSPSIDTGPYDRLVWFTVAMAVIGVIAGVLSLIG